MLPDPFRNKVQEFLYYLRIIQRACAGFYTLDGGLDFHIVLVDHIIPVIDDANHPRALGNGRAAELIGKTFAVEPFMV